MHTQSIISPPTEQNLVVGWGENLNIFIHKAQLHSAKSDIHYICILNFGFFFFVCFLNFFFQRFLFIFGTERDRA